MCERSPYRRVSKAGGDKQPNPSPLPSHSLRRVCPGLASRMSIFWRLRKDVSQVVSGGNPVKVDTTIAIWLTDEVMPNMNMFHALIRLLDTLMVSLAIQLQRHTQL